MEQRIVRGDPEAMDDILMEEQFIQQQLEELKEFEEVHFKSGVIPDISSVANLLNF